MFSSISRFIVYFKVRSLYFRNMEKCCLENFFSKQSLFSTLAKCLKLVGYDVFFAHYTPWSYSSGVNSHYFVNIYFKFRCKDAWNNRVKGESNVSAKECDIFYSFPSSHLWEHLQNNPYASYVSLYFKVMHFARF